MAAKFLAEAAVEYANQHDWKLPKKLKDAKTLQEIMNEHMEEAVKEIPESERYECEKCGVVVQEPDTFCWFCGHDTSDDGTGGFKPSDDAVEFESDSKKTDSKKTDSKKGKKVEEDPEEDPVEEPEEEKPKKGKKEEKSKGKKVEEDPVEEPEEEKPKKGKKEEKTIAKVEEDSVEGSVFKTLKEYTTAIRSLNANSGALAWRIGKLLLEVKETKQFKEQYSSMPEYVSVELGYSWQQARNFMRYAEVAEQSQAEKLGVYKLEVLARSPDESRDKILKAALPKEVGGQGKNRDQLEQLLKDEKEKYKGKEKSPRGRKPEPNKKMRIHDLLDVNLDVRIDSDGEGEELIPGTFCFIEVKVLKNKVKISFAEGEAED